MSKVAMEDTTICGFPALKGSRRFVVHQELSDADISKLVAEARKLGGVYALSITFKPEQQANKAEEAAKRISAALAANKISATEALRLMASKGREEKMKELGI